MKIAVRSKGGAKEFRCEQPWAAISIATYEGEHPVLSEENRIGLLQLAFRDTDFERQERAFTKEQARQVIEFVESIIHNAEFLLIHCEMGLSRSPGMAAALSKLYAGTDQYWFDRYTPNRMVYSKLVEAAVEYDKKFAKVFDRIE
jgi:predicted protein tyrosine phosphatase